MSNYTLILKQSLRVGLCILTVIAAVGVGGAQNTADIGEALRSQIDAILNVDPLASSYQGVDIETVKGKQVLYSRNADHVFLPASNNKLLTASAALALLGPDYRYRTTIVTEGTVTNGTLNGDLVIVGCGDPTLTSNDLDSMAGMVKAAGISSITGEVRYDASVFDDQWLGDSWSWDDEPYYYSAQIAGLNVDRNVIELTIGPGFHDGDPAIVSYTAGAVLCIKIENTTNTKEADGKAHIVVDRKRGQNIVTVSGTIPGSTRSRPITSVVTFENPPLYTASLLLDHLGRELVTVGNKHVSRCDDRHSDRHEVAVHLSLKLSEILSLMNKPSDNMVAECLLKTVGAKIHKIGTAGAGGTGATAARDWLTSIGLDKTQVRQVDGSGLSRQDYVSPLNLVRLLRYWSADPNGPTFVASLPIAGVDGTLRNRMKGTPASNNCRAKTGSLNQVSCLSGYVTSRDGVPLAFSVMINNQIGLPSASTKAENKIVELLATTDINPLLKSEAKAQ